MTGTHPTLGGYTAQSAVVNPRFGDELALFIAEATSITNAEGIYGIRSDEDLIVRYHDVLLSYLPKLDRFASHMQLGPRARALRVRVEAEMARAGAAINELGRLIPVYGGTARWSYTPGIGLKNLTGSR